MASLFSKDEDLLKSAPIVGADILRLLEKSDSKRVSIYDVVSKLKNKNISGVRTIYFSMIFLYSLDLIEFNEPFLEKVC